MGCGWGREREGEWEVAGAVGMGYVAPLEAEDIPEPRRVVGYVDVHPRYSRRPTTDAPRYDPGQLVAPVGTFAR